MGKWFATNQTNDPDPYARPEPSHRGDIAYAAMNSLDLPRSQFALWLVDHQRLTDEVKK